MLTFARSVIAPLAIASILSAQTPVVPGNILVVRVGTGAAALTNAATATFVDEYTPTGTLVRSIPMPTTPGGAQRALTNSGTATSEGHLSSSPDGRFYALAGYDAAPGTASIVGSASATTPRVIARIGLDGTLDTSTSTNSAFNANNIRTAITSDGVQFWAAGANSGVQALTLGATTSTAASTGTPTNLRTLGISGGNLYVTSASAPTYGILRVGTGLPTTGAALALLPGFPTTAGPSTYDFFFADANTVYVSDDRTAAPGGIQKWTFNGTTWSLAYSFLPAGASVRSLSGVVVSGITTLYATTTLTSANSIVSLTDLGATSTFTTIATTAANTALRGIRVAGQRYGVATVGAGSPVSAGIPAIGTSGGSPTIGNASFAVTCNNFLPFGLGGLLVKVGPTLPVGIQLPGAQPGCELFVGLPEDVFGIAFADALGAASYGLGLPADPFFIGIDIGAQWLVADPALAFALPIGSSAAASIRIGY
jgi:hypothetical protein